MVAVLLARAVLLVDGDDATAYAVADNAEWEQIRRQYPIVLAVIWAGGSLLFAWGVVLPAWRAVSRSIAIDGDGIWFMQWPRRTLLAWRDVQGVGFTGDKDSKWKHAIEIYPRDLKRYENDALMSTWLVYSSVSHDGMPGGRFILPSIRINPIRDKLFPSVNEHAPRSWVGGRAYGKSQRMTGT